MDRVHFNRVRLSWIVELFRPCTHLIQNDLNQVRSQFLTHTVSGFGTISGTLSLPNEYKTRLTIVAGFHLPVHGQVHAREAAL